jgi:hypothetical protein
MNLSTRVKLCAVAAMGLGALSVAGLNVAVAAGHSGTIHGCVANSDGALRIAKSASSCTSHEHSLSFNKRGPQGLQGLQGPQGPQGPQGAPGASGGSGGGSGTFQMYANVDQNGNLGSNFDAVNSARVQDTNGDTFYSVFFSKPVGSCAAVVEPGFAGGELTAHPVPTEVVIDPNNDMAFNAEFVPSNSTSGEASAFMMTVTCSS